MGRCAGTSGGQSGFSGVWHRSAAGFRLAENAGVIVAVAAKRGLDLDTEAVAAIISPILAYILGQGFADFGKSSK